jgi:SNF2 family DNA or RNA helicase
MFLPEPNTWCYSTEHNQSCRVIEASTLWGESLCRIWLPGSDAVVRVPASSLRPLSQDFAVGSDQIAYIAAAAKVADALTQDVLLAPIESSVIPLPHQLRALSRATSHDRVRYLLADEVGLGKTIEAGLIVRELKLRGLAQRILVLAPRGLVTQWVAEMHTHFNEEFHLLSPGDFGAFRRFMGDGNLWRTYDQVVCPMDSVKPLEKRRGWSKEKVAEYNRERFDDIVSAGWDIIIVDEAHRLGGSTEQVARHKLGQALAEAAPYLLLLSATPHQGKTDSFARLMALLDNQAFPDAASVSRDRVQPYVIRTEKRRAIDADGNPLFKPRHTRLMPVVWEERHNQQRRLYEAVTEYVRHGYNQALREKKNYIGFLMILMQRMVTSSTRAIRVALEKRLEVLTEPQEQLSLFPSVTEEEWEDMDGEEQFNALFTARLEAQKNERQEVELLLDAARHTESSGPDPKAELLLDTIYKLQQEESDPDLKVLVFTEFVPTQDMLRQYLSDRGISVVTLNGSMDMDERQRAQERFATKARIMISTDAGGEGLNLQFCHVVINFDIPWNPMKLEQRIGRVDRIGQPLAVLAINFVLSDTVEFRVREVLEEKLKIILREFGVDKTEDVLDSAEAGVLFDKLFAGAIVNPDELEAQVEKALREVGERAQATTEAASILGAQESLTSDDARKVLDSPLPFWVERMTVSYLKSSGGEAVKKAKTWKLRWPSGDEVERGVFSVKEYLATSSAIHLTLDHARIRGLAMRLPRHGEGQPIPCVAVDGLPADLSGYWSLWRIELHSVNWNRQRVLPLFLSDDGRTLGPTARHIWDKLLSICPEPSGYVDGQDAVDAYRNLWKETEEQGRETYEQLLHAHRISVARDKERRDYAFSARRKAIEHVGLPEVREHRLGALQKEEEDWREELARLDETVPEVVPLIILRIDGRRSDV